jgi:hypothetical protein
MLVHVVVGFAGCDAGDVLDFDEASAWGESRESRNGPRQKAGSTRPRSTIYEREFVRCITVVSFVHERTVHRPPCEAVESRNFDLEAWRCGGCMVWKVVIRGPRVGWSCASEQFQSDGLCPARAILYCGSPGGRVLEPLDMAMDAVWQIIVDLFGKSKMESKWSHGSTAGWGPTTRAAALAASSSGRHSSWMVTDVIFVCYRVTFVNIAALPLAED